MSDTEVPFSPRLAEAEIYAQMQHSFRHLAGSGISKSHLDEFESFLADPAALSRPSLIIRCRIFDGEYSIRVIVDKKTSQWRIGQCFAPFLERVLSRTRGCADFFALISDRLYVSEDRQARFREYLRCVPLMRCDYSDHDPLSLDSIMIPDSFLQERTYRDQLDSIEDAVRANPFEERKEIIKWRGNLSGSVHPTLENYRTFTRFQLVMLSRQFPHMLEAHLSNYDYGEEGAARAALRHQLEVELGMLPDWQPPAELVPYKYLISIDGSASAWKRVALILATGSVLLLQHRWKQFFYPGLKPWVHFVPIARDLSDVPHQYEWLLNHPLQAQTIAARGRQFAKQILSPSALEEYFLAVINQCSELYAD